MKGRTERTAAAIRAAAFVLALGALLLWAAAARGETMWVNVAEGSHLNARSKPRTGDIEAKLERGTEVEVTEIRSGWATIQGWGECWTCYVDARYLTEEKPGEEIECKPVEMQTSADKVRLRECPGGDVVKRLKKGQKVTVTGWMEHAGETWAKVDGGWLMMRYLAEVRSGAKD